MEICLFVSSISPLKFAHERCVTFSAKQIETPVNKCKAVGDPNKNNPICLRTDIYGSLLVTWYKNIFPQEIFFSARNIFLRNKHIFLRKKYIFPCFARNKFFSARKLFFPQEIFFSARNIFLRKKFFSPQEIYFSPQVIYFFSARNIYRKQARSVLPSVAGHSGAQQHRPTPLRARPLQPSKRRPFHTIIHKLNLAQFIDRWRHIYGCDYLSIEVLFHLGASFIIGN